MDEVIRAYHNYIKYADQINIGITTIQIIVFVIGIVFFFIKWSRLYSMRTNHTNVIASFWGAHTLGSAMDALGDSSKTRYYSLIACRGMQAINVGKRQEAQGISATLPLSFLMRQYMRQEMKNIRVKLHSGCWFFKFSQFFLPLIGAWGTVWQIYIGLNNTTHGWDMLTPHAFSPALCPLLWGLAGGIVMLWFNLTIHYSIKDVYQQLKEFRDDLSDYLVNVIGGRGRQYNQPAQQPQPEQTAQPMHTEQPTQPMEPIEPTLSASKDE